MIRISVITSDVLAFSTMDSALKQASVADANLVVAGNHRISHRTYLCPNTSACLIQRWRCSSDEVRTGANSVRREVLMPQKARTVRTICRCAGAPETQRK